MLRFLKFSPVLALITVTANAADPATATPPMAKGQLNTGLPASTQRMYGRHAPTTQSRSQRIVTKIDRSEVPEQMLKAAQSMEAMFLNQMYQSMRKTVAKSDFDLSNQATDIYQGMLDEEHAKSAAFGQGVGLADQIIAYYQSAGYYKSKGSVEHDTHAVTQIKTPSLPPSELRNANHPEGTNTAKVLTGSIEVHQNEN